MAMEAEAVAVLLQEILEWEAEVRRLKAEVAHWKNQVLRPTLLLVPQHERLSDAPWRARTPEQAEAAPKARPTPQVLTALNPEP